MKLYEYQAKELFKDVGITVPQSVLITKNVASEDFEETTINEVHQAVKILGLPSVVKSQLFIGGRGKMGLVRLAESKEDAENLTIELFNRKDYHVNTILIEQGVDFKKELYVAVTIDPVSASGMVMTSNEGGVEIEKLAKDKPEAIIKRRFDINNGLEMWQAKQLAFDLGLSGTLHKEFSSIAIKLSKLFIEYDAELVEINPLFVTSDNKLIAGDGKFTIDDNSVFRQNRFEKDFAEFENEIDREAASEGIPFLQFDGDISLMCAGAGLTTTVYDLIHYEGGSVANYLEFGGPNYHKAMKAMELCLKTKSKVILIVTFGTIARADVMAEGVVNAIKKLKPDRPIVICIRGTNEEEAVNLLKDAGLDPLFDTEEAVRRAVELSKQ